MSSRLPRPGPRARAVAAAIREQLRELGSAGMPASDAALDALFASVDEFHRLLFEESGAVVRCAQGCANCCSQLVFDVHAFEVERIGRHLRADPTRALAVVEGLDRRIAAFDAVRREHAREPGESVDDWEERVAIEFWKLDLPCVPLDANGSCSVHALRPWSCRRHFSLGDPTWCRGDTARDPRHEGFLADPLEDIDALLAALDRSVDFDAGTDRLDLALQRWFATRGR